MIYKNLLQDIKEYLLATQAFYFHGFQLSSRKNLLLAVETWQSESQKCLNSRYSNQSRQKHFLTYHEQRKTKQNDIDLCQTVWQMNKQNTCRWTYKVPKMNFLVYLWSRVISFLIFLWQTLIYSTFYWLWSLYFLLIYLSLNIIKFAYG